MKLRLRTGRIPLADTGAAEPLEAHDKKMLKDHTKINHNNYSCYWTAVSSVIDGSKTISDREQSQSCKYDFFFSIWHFQMKITDMMCKGLYCGVTITAAEWETERDNEAFFKNIKGWGTFNPCDLMLYWATSKIPTIPVQVLHNAQRGKLKFSGCFMNVFLYIMIFTFSQENNLWTLMNITLFLGTFWPQKP